MIPPRGTVVTATDPFGETPIRPFVLVSDATTSHPFPDNESVGIVVTTTQRAVETCQHAVDALDTGDLPHARTLLDEAGAAVERAQHDENGQAQREIAYDCYD